MTSIQNLVLFPTLALRIDFIRISIKAQEAVFIKIRINNLIGRQAINNGTGVQALALGGNLYAKVRIYMAISHIRHIRLAGNEDEAVSLIR